MEYCYHCNCVLIDEKEADEEQIKYGKISSEEHIIPNFCGGHLKTKSIICKSCNNELGKLEGVLSQKLIMAYLFQYKLDRGKQLKRSIAGITESGREVIVDNGLNWKFSAKQLYIDNQLFRDGKSNFLKFNTKKEAKQFEKKFKEGILTFSPSEEYLEEKVYFHNQDSFSEEPEFKAILKIAIHYYLFNDHPKEYIDEPISYLFDSESDSFRFVLPYYSLIPIYKPSEGELSHVIYLKGDHKKQFLYCYIELFNTLKFLVLLNTKYKGPYFNKTYCWDLLNANEKEINLNFTLMYNIWEYYNYNESIGRKPDWKNFKIQNQEGFIDSFDRFLNIIEKFQEDIG